MPSIICCSQSTLCRYQYTAKSYALYTDAWISVAYVLKKSTVAKKAGKKLTAPPKLEPFYDKRLKSTDAKELSASALMSDNTVDGINI